MKRFISVTTLLLTTATLGQAQQTYYTALEAELEATYGLTGGIWVFGSDETGVLNDITPFGQIETDILDVTGQPFTKAMQARNPVRAANPWERKIELLNDVAFVQNGTLLLVLWIRGIEGERKNGQVTIQFEEASSPFGKSLDESVALDSTWQRLLLPFRVSRAFAPGEGRFQITFGNQAQTFEIGGIGLRYYGLRYGLDELPRSGHNDGYGGQDPNAPWRTEAQARIEQLRKRDLAVEVVDAEGGAVSGAEISVELEQHAFGFGTAVALSQFLDAGPDGDVYREKLENLNGDGKTFSLLVIENALKWPTWENPDWPASKEETAEAIQWFRQRSFPIRGHNLIWPGWQFMPDDMEANQNDPAYLRQRIREHFDEILNFPGIAGEIREWDVVNEPVHVKDLETVFGGPGIYTEWFKLAAEEDANTRLFINDYSMITRDGTDLASQEAYKEIIQRILDEGGRIDGIGLQGHMDQLLTGMETAYEIFDEFAVFEAELSITEYDAVGVDEELAGSYLRDFLTLAFSHPAVGSFLMWGFWDGAHWGEDAPIFRRDWSLKPSGEAFLDLVFNQWWTSEQLTTDGSGSGTVRGFMGQYRIGASAPGFENGVSMIDMTSDTSVTMTLSAAGTIAPPAPGRLEITSQSTGLVELAWTDQSVGEDGFVIERKAGEAEWAVLDSVGTDMTTYADSTVGAGTLTYRVYAYNGVGDSAPTNEASASLVDANGRATYGNGGTPGSGAPWGVPSTGTLRIEAENYNQGGPGVAYRDDDVGNNGGGYRTEDVDIEVTTDEGGGFNVGWTETGEWLHYTLDVEQVGTYAVRLRIARETEGPTSLRLLAGPDPNTLADLTGTVTIPSTAGWQVWQTVSVSDIAFTAGEQILRIDMTGDLFNLNWIEIGEGAAVPLETDHLVEFGLGVIYPNPLRASGTVRFAVQQTQPVRVVLYDALGRRRQVLYDGWAPGGQSQHVVVSATELPSGLYLIRLEGASLNESRMVMVVQ